MMEMEKVFPRAWKAIALNQASNLQRLDLCFFGGSVRGLLALVPDTIPSMPQLRSLIVSDRSTVRMMTYEDIKQENIPSIRSKSLQELTMYCKYRYTIDTPELQTFAGALCALLPPDSSDKEQLELTKLKKLDVTVWSWKPADRSVFRRMPNLAEIHWDIPVEHDLFVAMCKTCPHLTDARFSKELVISNHSSFKHLSKLAQLRILRFSDIQYEDDVFMDLSKLSHLEELRLGHTHLLPVSLLSFSKSIRKLGLHIYGGVELSLVEITVRNLPQLTELYLNGHTVPISSSALRALLGFEHLEVLEFSHFHFTQSKFLEMNAPMHKVRTLRFHCCKLETKQLFGLQDKFPKLQNTVYEECEIDDEPKDDQIRTPYDLNVELAKRLNVPLVPNTSIYR
uniref:Uncharacterized protein n=1 Tax=Anopheles aquasalis TaxID=42839 RepID=T1E8G8_ANOAQ